MNMFKIIIIKLLKFFMNICFFMNNNLETARNQYMCITKYFQYENITKMMGNFIQRLYHSLFFISYFSNIHCTKMKIVEWFLFCRETLSKGVAHGMRGGRYPPSCTIIMNGVIELKGRMGESCGDWHPSLSLYGCQLSLSFPVILYIR